MQEARSRWTLTGLVSAWGLIPATIREAFPATGVDSTRDRKVDLRQEQHFAELGREHRTAQSNRQFSDHNSQLCWYQYLEIRSNSDSQWFSVDTIVYEPLTSVLEPSTLGLIGLGLLGLGARQASV
jgi:hypothetical protein